MEDLPAPGQDEAVDVRTLEERVASLLREAGGASSPEAVEVVEQVRRELHEALGACLDAINPAPPHTSSAVEGARALHRVVGELLDEGAVARLRMAERIRLAVSRLAEAGPPSEIVHRAPAEVAEALDLDRVVLSGVRDAQLVVEAVHCRPGADDADGLLARLRTAPVPLAYPLVEAEMLRRRRAGIVRRGDHPAPDRRAFGDVMDWTDYVAAPVVLEGRVLGFLHADRSSSGRALQSVDRDALGSFGDGFSAVFLCAVLRQRLRIQGQELRRVASWAEAATGALSDSAIDLAGDGHASEADPAAPAAQGDAQLRDLLTRRELDVLEHMVKGETNLDIARALVVSEGTVKFHVKNILRKLHASNRAAATSRYLRLALRDANGAAGAHTRPPA